MKKLTMRNSMKRCAAWTLTLAMAMGGMTLPMAAEEMPAEAYAAKSIDAVDVENATNVTVVTNVTGLENALGDANTGDVVVLGNDITVRPSDWFYGPNTFYGILDGNGYTITIDGDYPILNDIDSGAVVQNLGIKGTIDLDDDDESGAICSTLYGKLINCYSTATLINAGDNCGGLVGITNGNAIISNCYFAGSFSGSDVVAGGIAGGLYRGTSCENSYWLTQSSTPTRAVLDYIDEGNCSSKAKSALNAALLNATAGSNYLTWKDVTDGTPMLVKVIPQYPVFTADPSGAQTTVTDGTLNLQMEDITRFVAGTGIAGTLTISNFDGEVIWLLAPEYYDIYKVMPIGIGKYSGELYVKYAAEAEIIAYDKSTCDQFGEPLADGSSTELARIKVVVSNPENIDDIRVLAGETPLEDGAVYNVNGGEWVELIPQVHDANTDEWKTMGPATFEFPESDDAQTYMAMRNSYRSKGGDFTLTIKGFERSITIDFKCTYVPVSSITPNFDRVYTIHGRDSMGNFPMLTSGALNNSVVCIPENATYAYEWTMTSSNEKVAVVVPGISVRPVAAGTTTIKVESNDPQAAKPVSGKKTITFRYMNPLNEVTLVTGLDEDQEYPIQIQEGDTDVPILLLFEGEREDCHVTEAGMVWTYSQNGICEIYRRGEVMEITNDDTDYNDFADDAQYVSNDKYLIKGLKKGVVTVTGTPVDTTNGAEPVVFKVAVGVDNPAQEEADQAIIDRFKDVDEDDWYAPYVVEAYKAGIMKGKNEDTFAPAAKMTRAEFAQIIYNMVGEEVETVKSVFPDVSTTAWYAKAVQKANEMGIINGYQSGSKKGLFGPSDNVTREQIAVMLYRYANTKGLDVSAQEDLSKFADASKVTFGKEAMAWAVAKGIITGTDNGTTLTPSGLASRAEVATMVVRFLDAYEE